MAAALVQPNVSNMNDAIWSYLNARNEWEQLDVPSSNTIELAFSSGSQDLFEIKLRDNKIYYVDISESSMTSKRRGRDHVMKLQRHSNKSDNPSVIWEWSDNGIWMEYGLDEIDFLNVAKAARYPDISIFIGAGSSIYAFKIDFDNNRQISISGRGTGYMRPIRSRAVNPSGSAPSQDRAPILTGSAREQLIQNVLAKADKGTANPDDECIVCMEPFTQTNHCHGSTCDADSTRSAALPTAITTSSESNISYRLPSCGPHFYHQACILTQLRTNGKCAVCGTHFLVLEGTQPKNGVMTHRTYPPGQIPLQGFPPTIGTIVISYSFPSGIQGAEHPNPGSHYSGTQRTAYLPDNGAGKELLELLQRAFRQRLVFTIGRSVTTGMDNCVVWNGIHHKTNTAGGSSHFGWPDETYFERVKEELKAKGITP